MRTLRRIAVSLAATEVFVDVLGFIVLAAGMEANSQRGLLTGILAITLLGSAVVLLYGYTLNPGVAGAPGHEWHIRAIVYGATIAALMEILSLVLLWAGLDVDRDTVRTVLWVTMGIAFVGDGISSYYTIRY